MDIIQYKIVTADRADNLLDRSDKVSYRVWPEFMMHDPVSNRCWVKLYEQFAPFQFILEDPNNGKVAAVGNSIPFRWEDSFEALPEKGWDEILMKGVDDFEKGLEPNVFSALSIVVAADYKGKGLSYAAVNAMKSIGRAAGLKAMAAPVRPNRKAEFPLISMDDYISWRLPDGNAFDPWIRVHEKLGARIVKICPESMHIEGNLESWQEWTGCSFPGTGDYTVSGALVPVHADTQKNRAIYVEPNVWMVHEL